MKKGGEGSKRERDKCVSTTNTELVDTINTIILQYPLWSYREGADFVRGRKKKTKKNRAHQRQQPTVTATRAHHIGP